MIKSVRYFALLAVLSACAAEPELKVTCTDPRPEVCAMQYLPVCAVKNMDVQCVTTPCEATEQKTYSNGCMACRDKSVNGYNQGRCEVVDK